MNSIPTGTINTLFYFFTILYSIISYAAPGDIDTSFGNNGIVITDFDFDRDSDSAYTMLIKPDGKILLAGTAGGVTYNYNIGMTRYLADGSLDNSFGGRGKILQPISEQTRIFDMTLQTDSKILVVGTTQSAISSEDSLLARFNTNGFLDKDFGDNGYIIIKNKHSTARGVAVTPSGKILVTGSTYNELTEFDFYLMSFNLDGSIDTAFGDNGLITTDFYYDDDSPLSIAIRANGKILLGGLNASGIIGDNSFALIQYNKDGSLDYNFGINGKTSVDIGSRRDEAWAMKILGDGKILLGGFSDQIRSTDFALMRFNKNGSLDSTFGYGHGIVITDISGFDDEAYALEVQADGKILLAGASYNGTNNDFALVCYDKNGFLDLEFGDGGKMLAKIGTRADRANAIAIQKDGKILLAGYSSNDQDSDFAMIRVEPDLDLISSSGSFNLFFIISLTLLLFVAPRQLSAN